jgi:type III restriction enzyme
MVGVRLLYSLPAINKEAWKTDAKLLRPSKKYPSGYELVLVNLVRERVETWSSQGYSGVSRTTLELIQWWTGDGREKRLFFAQLESALTIIFLTEARPDFLQGIANSTRRPQ